MSHPVEETLLQYRFGTLDAETSAHVGEHLRTCSECTRTYARLGDSIERLGAYDVEGGADEEALTRALERASEAFNASPRQRAAKRAAARAPVSPEAPAPAPQPPFTPSEVEGPPVDDEPLPGFWAWLGVQPGASARPLRLATLAVLVLSTTWVGGGAVYLSSRPAPLETRVSGESSLQAGGNGLVQVEVWRDGAPVADAPVSLALLLGKGRVSLFEGRTDSAGNAEVSVAVPYTDEPSPQLEVTTRAGAESDVVTKPLQLERSYKVHLSTDKPLYQPGQTIHLRSLVMRAPRPEPASGRTVVFEVRDARNARLASKSVQVGPYGVASFDLELSDDVALGTWKATATVDGVTADAQVEVSRYTLPKFKLAIAPDRETYLAGERFKARVTARYFFGKPVVGAQVHGLVLRQDGTVLAELAGKTDGDGTLTLVTELPSKLAAPGRPEPVVLQLEAKDAAGQQERSERAVTVSRELLQVEVIPEGTPATGFDNGFFVVTSTPDGRAIPCKVELTPVTAGPPPQPTFARLGNVAPATAKTLGMIGSIDKDLVAKVINARPEVSSCYERALRVNPSLAGKVVVEWEITSRGSVGYSKVKSSTLQSAPLEACLLSSMRTWRFERPADGRSAIITFAFHFGLGAPPPAAPTFVATPIGAALIVRTAENGIGRFVYAPKGPFTFQVRVEDAEGRRASRDVAVQPRGGAVLTTDKAFYRPGETVKVELQSASGAAELEARSEGRLIARAPFLAMAAGKSGASLAIPPRFVGTLELGLPQNLYAVPVSPHRIVVAEPSGLTVKMTTDKPTYRPGEPATLRFTVTDSQGKPKVAALGLSIVDESLFALTSSQPALVRAFFLVERALLAPRFGVSVGELVASNSWTGEQQVAGRLLLSLAAPQNLRSGVLRFSESTVAPKLVQRKLEQDRWALSSVFVALGAGLLFLLVFVATLSARLSPTVGALVLAAALLGAGFLRLPWQVQIFGGGLIALAATVAATRRTSQAPFVLFLIPAMAVVVSLATWSPRPFSALTPGFQPVPVVTSVTPAAPSPKDTSGVYAKAEKKVQGSGALKAMAKLAPMADKASIGDLGSAGLSLAPTPPAAPDEPPRREVRVRQHFPETLYVNPQLVADEQGVAELTVPLADSITAWRVSALASSDGKLGTMDAPLKVFQDFFVDLDVPVALVRGDEATVPIALYNYLETAQDVRLEVERQPWFELVGEAPTKVSLAASGVEGRELRIRVLQAGEHKLTVRADGLKESDVVARELLVTEAGREDQVTVSGTVTPGTATKVALEVPEAAVGATRVLVKLFPTLAATALDGIEGTLAQPTGCFEQTSAAAYPNVLVEEFLRREGRLTPELERRGARYLSLGYQKLVSFEVPGGGFEWFGRAPANQVLTAYGLMEFSDMRRVFPVEPALIERTQRFLLSRQKSDGSWDADQQMIRDGLWRSEHRGRVAVTAYVAWALAESGLRAPELERAQRFLEENLGDSDDAYTLALITAGFAKTGHAETARAADLLGKRARRVEGLVVFNPAGATAYYGRGAAADVETTALAAYALAKAGREPALVKGALDFLLARRLGHGAWPSTQGTILALKALLAGTETKGVPKVSVSINGAAAGTFLLNEGKVKVLDLGDRARKGMNVIELSSDVSAPFIATATYTLPWRQQGEDDGKPLALSVDYGAKKVDVGGVVPVDVRVTYRGAEASGMALVELGVPAGLTPLLEDLEGLRASKLIAKFQVSAGKVRFYLDRLSPQERLSFTLRFKATTPVDTRGAGSLAYLYYDPAVRASAPPVAVAVR